MRNCWRSIKTKLIVVNTKLESVLPKLNPRTSKELIEAWNDYKVELKKLDGMMSVSPREVKLPFASDTFKNEWNEWKNYLAEQHNVFMCSRSEVYALKLLSDFAENNEEKAIYFLHYAMAYRYKNFFKLKEETVSEPPKENANDTNYF